MIRSRFAAIVAGTALAASGLAVGLVTVAAAPAGAATTYTVDNATDIGAAVPSNCTTPVAGACRLVDAFAAADAVDGDVTIQLAAPGGVISGTGDTYNGGGGAGGHTLTVEGNGQTIDSDGTSSSTLRVFGGTLIVNSLSIISDYTGINGDGDIRGNDCFIAASVIDDNVVAQGIYTQAGAVTLQGCIVDSNGQGNSGAVGVEAIAGNVTIVDSQVDASSIEDYGTAVQAGDTATITRSTVSGTGVTGTGVIGSDGVVVVNSTVANSTNAGISSGGAVTLAYSDVIGNAQAADSEQIESTSLTVFGSVIAEAGAGNANCDVVTVTSQGYNYSDDPDATSSCQLDNATDRVGATNDPKLGTLGDNGGPTETFLPLAGSPLVDAIPSPACQTGAAAGVTTDQRGFPRPAISPGGISLACDVGSVELQPDVPVVPSPAVIQPSFTG